MRDLYNRPIRYLRVSVTDRCNLRCAYCAPRGQPRPIDEEGFLPFEDIARIVSAAVGLGVDKVRLTGGEPLAREGIVGLVAELAGIAGLETLCMTTNGTLLAGVAADLKSAGLDSLNLSLDSLDPARYKRITGGGSLADALEGLDAALKAGIPVKVNIVVSDGECEGDAAEVERYAHARGAASQRIRRYDLRLPKVDDTRFDRPPPCGRCDRIRLLADGRLKPCLHSDISVPVDMNRIEESILACVAMKPERGGACAVHAVGRIGG